MAIRIVLAGLVAVALLLLLAGLRWGPVTNPLRPATTLPPTEISLIPVPTEPSTTTTTFDLRFQPVTGASVYQPPSTNPLTIPPPPITDAPPVTDEPSSESTDTTTTATTVDTTTTSSRPPPTIGVTSPTAPSSTARAEGLGHSKQHGRGRGHE